MTATKGRATVGGSGGDGGHGGGDGGHGGGDGGHGGGDGGDGRTAGAGAATAPIPTSYERARDELSAVVAALEEGGLTLDQSLTLWERGQALAAACETFLAGARARVEAALAESDESEVSNGPDGPDGAAQDG